MSWRDRERFLERDTVIREANMQLLQGEELPPDLAEQFFSGVAQIAARTALRKGASGDLVDDVVGDTLLKVFEAMRNGRCIPGDSPMAAYVSRAAGWNTINLGKAARNRREEYLEEFVPPKRPETWPPRPVEYEVEMRMYLEQLGVAVGDLPDNQRGIVAMLPYFTHEEICERLGLTDSALRNRIYRARQTLLENLGGSW